MPNLTLSNAGDGMEAGKKSILVGIIADRLLGDGA